MKKHPGREIQKNRDSRIRQNDIGVFAATTLILTSIVGALIASCTIGSYHFRPSSDVSRQFENGEIVSGYRYYVSSPANKPLAIVAIRDDYHMQSEHWRKIEVDSASLKALVERISYVLGSEYKEDQKIPNGAVILGPDGEKVGMWYSVYDYSAVTFPGDMVIHIAMPMTRFPLDVRLPRD